MDAAQLVGNLLLFAPLGVVGAVFAVRVLHYLGVAVLPAVAIEAVCQ